MDDELGKMFAPKVFGLEGMERYEVMTSQPPCTLPELRRKLNAPLTQVDSDYVKGESLYRSYEFKDVAILTKRNFRWIRKIIDFHMHLDGPVLFGFGQFHLGGSTGILELLKQFGFSIHRVNLLGEAVPCHPYPSHLLPDSKISKLVKAKVDTFSQEVQDVIQSHKLPVQPELPPHIALLVKEYMFPDPDLLGEYVEFEGSDLDNLRVKISGTPIKPKFR